MPHPSHRKSVRHGVLPGRSLRPHKRKYRWVRYFRPWILPTTFPITGNTWSSSTAVLWRAWLMSNIRNRLKYLENVREVPWLCGDWSKPSTPTENRNPSDNSFDRLKQKPSFTSKEGLFLCRKFFMFLYRNGISSLFFCLTFNNGVSYGFFSRSN